MYKRLKIKLYPTLKQKVVLEDHLSAYRFLYNLSLEYKIMMYKDYGINITGYNLQKEIFELRKEYEWLSKCKAECLRDAGLNVDKSFKNFFKGSGYPKFKTKKSVQSFHAYQSIKCVDNEIYFYKQKIKFKSSKKYIDLLNTHKIKQVTFKKDKCGDYYATCLIDTEITKKLPETQSILKPNLAKESNPIANV